MADVSAVTTGFFPTAKEGFTTTLASTISSGAATVPLNSVAGFSNGQYVVLVVEPTSDTAKQAFTGQVDTAGVQITGVKWTEGTNQSHAAGATVVDYETATHWALYSKGLLVEHNQDGTHADVTAETLAVSGATTLTGALTVKSYDGWINTADTWTYASATTFTIAGVDRTAQFPVGTKIKLTQTTAKYFYVTASAFGTDTTVTITGGSDYSLANAAITSPALSYDATPQGFPQRFAFTPSWTNLTTGNGTNVGYFSMQGRQVTVKQLFTFGSTSAMGTAPRFALPIAPNTDALSSIVSGFAGTANINDATGSTYPSLALYSSASSGSCLIRIMAADVTSASHREITATVPFTWTTSDTVQSYFTYEV